jgi:death-on-curing protein
MEIPLTEDWLKELYSVLIKIYKDTDDPIRTGFPIVSDFNEPMLNVCVNRPHTKVFGKVIYPHVLQRASVNMHSIINFHPFVDGNKRMALLSTYYYLRWNGYTFTIPKDADVFTIRIAKERLELNPILSWLTKNTKRTVYNILRNWECQVLSDQGKVTASKVFSDNTLLSVYLPKEGLKFFVSKIRDEQKKKSVSKTI